MAVFIIIFALALDYLLGEPRRFHPVVGLGNYANWVERKVWSKDAKRTHGLLALVAVLFPIGFSVWILFELGRVFYSLEIMLSILCVYFCIAKRSLSEHGIAVYDALKVDDLFEAREKVAMMVSRDCTELTATQVSQACCESVLENGSDSIFAAVFWFYIFGVYGIIIFRVINTLDAMWGYKNDRYQHFGWASAKVDDVLNWLPARLVAISYALLGDSTKAFHCLRTQAKTWKSSNAGSVMSAGAGSLGVQLGGDAVYHGVYEEKPVLGIGRSPCPNDILRAIKLVDRTVYLWLFCLLVITAIGMIDV